MLTELKLTNFRIFDDEVTVRFRPITVLIGRNSSGKSSIIKFLLMLRQSQGPGKTQFLSPEGDLVNLGVFAELRNALTRKRNLKFELTAKGVDTQFSPTGSRQLREFGELQPDLFRYKAEAMVAYSGKAGKSRVGYSLLEEKSGTVLSTGAWDAPAFWSDPPLPNILRNLSNSEGEAEPVEVSGEIRDAFARFVALREIIYDVRYEVNALRHLTPVRAEAQRVIVAGPPPIDNVGQSGENTLPHLHRMITEQPSRYDFLLPHLQRVAGISGVEFKTSTRPRWVSQAFAKNKATGAKVHIADYGFGVGQCLPIFVQGAIMPADTTLMVEQPEAQLHPTAQLELGSYFADLWRQRRVGSVIETHSDNILLRLRRLVAKGELAPEDISVAYFTFNADNRNMPAVKNLDINRDGSLAAGLPMEFFGADIIEGLQLGARV